MIYLLFCVAFGVIIAIGISHERLFIRVHRLIAQVELNRREAPDTATLEARVRFLENERRIDPNATYVRRVDRVVLGEPIPEGVQIQKIAGTEVVGGPYGPVQVAVCETLVVDDAGTLGAS